LYGIVPVLHIGTIDSSRTREWAAITARMGLASPFITFLNIKIYAKYGKYAQYAQYARYLPACHQSRHPNNVERHIHNT
jgi:hypothetical protein